MNNMRSIISEILSAAVKSSKISSTESNNSSIDVISVNNPNINTTVVTTPPPKSDKKLIETIYSSIVNKLNISAEKDNPTFDQIRQAANKTHPGLTLDTDVLKRIRDRLHYDRHVLRVKEGIAHYPRACPNENQLTKFLKEKCLLSKRLLLDIRNQWVPSERRGMSVVRQIDDQNTWYQCILNQTWPSCTVLNHDDPSIGKAVYAKVAIKKGQIVCDYHGDLISHSEGISRYDQYPPEINHYMFFSHLKARNIV